MVAPFTDLRDGVAEDLIYLVLSGFTTRPTLPASLLISAHNASRAGRLLAITKISLVYPQICVSLFKIVLLCSRFFSALWRTRLNKVADKPSPFFLKFVFWNELLNLLHFIVDKVTSIFLVIFVTLSQERKHVLVSDNTILSEGFKLTVPCVVI